MGSLIYALLIFFHWNVPQHLFHINHSRMHAIFKADKTPLIVFIIFSTLLWGPSTVMIWIMFLTLIKEKKCKASCVYLMSIWNCVLVIFLKKFKIFLFLFYFKWIFFNIFKLLWCVNIKNNFKKIKNYYFNIL